MGVDNTGQIIQSKTFNKTSEDENSHSVQVVLYQTLRELSCPFFRHSTVKGI